MNIRLNVWLGMRVAVLAAAFGFAWSGAVAAAESPNDPHYDKQRYLQQIHMPEAWEYIRVQSHTLQTVIVAVVDTGVDLNHPDLSGRLSGGTNILQPKQLPQDDNGHGTSVAGVIAAVANNGVGIAGIAPNVQIMPVKAIAKNGIGEEEHLGQGIRYAVDQGADIIVLSLGLHLYSPYLSDIVAYAESKGVLLVAATGNDGKTVRYPAAYPTVVAVGGASIMNEYKTSSNFGPEVDFVAPWYVYTTALGGNYVYKEGTSMAAPQVAAVAALMLGVQPDLTPSDIRERLRQSAEPLQPAWNTRTGYGLLRADQALTIVPKLDGNEPNDRREDAKPTSVVGIILGEITNRGDADWFAFDPPYRGEIHVTVRGRRGNALPLELVLDQGDGSQPTRYSLSDGLPVRLPAATGKRLTVKLRTVSNVQISEAMPYRMETNFLMYRDPYEVNDKAYEAYLLPPKSQEVKGTFHKVDDQDWYAITFEGPGTITVRLDTDTLRIDPELYVVEKGGAEGIVFDDGNEGDSEITGPIPVKPDTYYLRVRNVKALNPLPVTGEYKLTIHYEKKFFDAFEPNNRSYQATTMTASETYKGVFDSAKDEDWFQIRLSRRSLVTVDVNQIPLDRYMYYALYTSTTQQKYIRANAFGKAEMRMAHDLQPGVYYIRLMTDAAYQDKQYSIRYNRVPLVAGFTDIGTHWAREGIQELVDKNVVKGYGNYRFVPNGTLTRAEAAAIVARAYGLQKAAGKAAFPDVPDSHWAYAEVNAAAAAGMVQGYPDGTFRPNDPVTRAEMTVMAAIAAKVGGSKKGTRLFTDVLADHWASDYIQAFVNNKLVEGFKDGTFRPGAQATRAEISMLLARLLQ
jgi:hypothetical protein